MYLAFKSLHIIAVISWMAGVLYLYRLFIYHTENLNDSSRTSMLMIMERKLFKYITVPAMIVAWVAALAMLILNPELLRQGWLHAKLLLVILLSGVTLYGFRVMKDLESGARSYSSKFLRVMNEVPTLLMIGAVLLVVYRFF